MTKRDLFSVAIRIVGVLLLLYAVEMLASGVYTQLLIRSGAMHGFSPADNALATLTSVLVLAVPGCVLLLWAEGIAHLLIRQDSEMQTPDVASSQAEWFGVAARVVGVAALALGVPRLVSTLIQAAGVSVGETRYFGLADKLEVFIQKLAATHLDLPAYTALVQIIFGIYLVWGAQHLTRLVFRSKPPVQTGTDDDA